MPTEERLAPAYRELLLLRAARETGALDALATEAGTASELAAATGIEARAAEVLVRALADLGFLERVGEEYEPTNRMLGFLTTTDLRSVGSLPGELDALEAWLALPETMHGGDPPEGDPRHALGARWAVPDAAVRAAVTAGVRAAPDADSVVVLRDGPGRHAREFAERGFDVTLVETPGVVEHVRPLAARGGVEVVAGDPRESLPDADLVAGVGALRRYGEADARAVVGTAADAAPVVAFVDAFRGRAASAPLLAVHALATGEGRVHGDGEVRGWLADAGLDAAVETVPGTDLAAAVGRRVE